jgi:hypothetical protein
MNPDPMDMLVKLYDLPKSCAVFDRLGEQGIHIRRALAAEKHKIAAWVRENFAEGWASETEIAFSRQPISCFIAVRESRVVGFACHDATFRNFFGPTGVKLEVKKSGIGSGLLFACLEDCADHRGGRPTSPNPDRSAPRRPIVGVAIAYTLFLDRFISGITWGAVK